MRPLWARMWFGRSTRATGPGDGLLGILISPGLGWCWQWLTQYDVNATRYVDGLNFALYYCVCTFPSGAYYQVDG